MRKYGRYTQLHPGTTLRIIALNTLVLDATNSYIWKNMTDQLGQLRWLRETLDYAEMHKESVLILGHYPPYSGFTMPGT